MAREQMIEMDGVMPSEKTPGLHDTEVRTAGVSIVRTTGIVWRDYAAADVRDAFLASLDDGDDARTLAIARHLIRCVNPLPSVTCLALGVASGSSYGAGALAVIERAARK